MERKYKFFDVKLIIVLLLERGWNFNRNMGNTAKRKKKHQLLRSFIYAAAHAQSLRNKQQKLGWRNEAELQK